jgi:hypothetical protein
VAIATGILWGLHPLKIVKSLSRGTELQRLSYPLLAPLSIALAGCCISTTSRRWLPPRKV